MERHPLVRDAFESDHITREQARLILKIVDKKNERAWIDYAAHVPTATLKEEVERCRRILEYDFLAAGYYAILPGFRYITDDRFHELPKEIQDIIRTGAWYQSPSMASSWPLEEDDEQDVMDRDLRLEEPWRYFEDVDEHHRHILHDLMALKIEGTAPHNLTFTFDPTSSHGDGPFLIYHKGRKKR